jgi:hypothetical protein
MYIKKIQMKIVDLGKDKDTLKRSKMLENDAENRHIVNEMMDIGIENKVSESKSYLLRGSSSAG